MASEKLIAVGKGYSKESRRRGGPVWFDFRPGRPRSTTQTRCHRPASLARSLARFIVALAVARMPIPRKYKSSNNWTISNVPGFQHFAQDASNLLDRQLLAADELLLVVLGCGLHGNVGELGWKENGSLEPAAGLG